MFKALKNALSIKDIRKKLLFTFLMVIVIRLGCQLPIPGSDADVLESILSSFEDSDAFSFFSAFTGGSFEMMSLFALSITPYITSSIIMQLLTIAIPKLEELQKDGETGRKTMAKITRFVTVGLSLIEAIAMTIGLGNQELFGDVSGTEKFATYVVSIAAMVGGSTLLMWIGERITESGIGNGISIVLLVNILSTIPDDIYNLFQEKVIITDTNNRSIGMAVLSAIIILLIFVVLIAYIVILQNAERRIPVQYAKKLQGRRMYGGQSTNIPLKVNTAGVMPVIFASSLMSFPVIISNLFGKQAGDGTTWGKVLKLLTTSAWFDTSDFKWTLGFVIYAVLVIAFAYFYTAITFNPAEIADNMKKMGGAIPGIRPGKTTEEYLTRILNAVIFIGAIGLLLAAMVPIIASGLTNVSLSFGGTSIIIVVGVIIETLSQIKSMMVSRNYEGFLE